MGTVTDMVIVTVIVTCAGAGIDAGRDTDEE